MCRQQTRMEQVGNGKGDDGHNDNNDDCGEDATTNVDYHEDYVKD